MATKSWNSQKHTRDLQIRKEEKEEDDASEVPLAATKSGQIFDSHHGKKDSGA